jgi:hypothetical protein
VENGFGRFTRETNPRTTCNIARPGKKEAFYLYCYLIAMKNIIGIQKLDIISMASRESRISRRRCSCVDLPEKTDPNVGKALDFTNAAVRRAVINYDNFDVSPSLSENRIQCLTDILFRVEARNEN